jgi:cellulose synthase (UDP-forming)
MVLGYFQGIRPLERKPTALPRAIELWPSVDVMIPTYNEPLSIIKPTILSAKNIDWPKDRLRIYVLDDGRRPEIRDFAEQCGVGYITRADNSHAKAGNLNHALKQTAGEFVAVFDCDHVPTRSFLQLTMGGFLQDPKLGLVQTPHHFYTRDPFERNLGTGGKVPNENELFYGVTQPGNDFWNTAFFCGS